MWYTSSHHVTLPMRIWHALHRTYCIEWRTLHICSSSSPLCEGLPTPRVSAFICGGNVLFYAQLRYHCLPSYLTGEKTSIFMTITIPLSVIPYNLVDGNWCFRGTCCPHLQGRNSVLASQMTWHPIPKDSNSVVKIPKTDKYRYHNCHLNHHCHHHYYHSHALYALQM